MELHQWIGGRPRRRRTIHEMNLRERDLRDDFRAGLTDYDVTEARPLARACVRASARRYQTMRSSEAEPR